MNQNLYQAFAGVFSDHLAAPVLHLDDGTVIDYATLDAMSARYANLLLALGAETGDRVTVQCDKSVETLWLYLGTIRAGLVYHPLNNAYQENELAYFLSNAAPRIVVGDNTTLPTLKQLAAADATVIGLTALAERATAASDQFQTVTSDAADLAALLYSSGTTGVPKGIMLTHGNLASNARTLVESWGFTRADVLLHALPIFHVHGLFVGISCVLMSGAAMVWQNGFSAAAVTAALPRCSVMMGVPTYYTRLLGYNAFNAAQCDSMRLFISGSAPLLPETFESFEQRTGHRILE
ncbi:MAG: AMP-binding protein, partial [Pseudomonadales bacterium]